MRNIPRLFFLSSPRSRTPLQHFSNAKIVRYTSMSSESRDVVNALYAVTVSAPAALAVVPDMVGEIRPAMGKFS